MKERLGIFVAGAIIGAALVLRLQPGGPSDAEIEAERARGDSLAVVSELQGNHIAVLADSLAAQTTVIDALRARAQPLVDKARTQYTKIAIEDAGPSVARIDAPKYALPFSDTTAFTTIQRHGLDPLPYLAPKFLTVAFLELRHTVFVLDTLNIRQQERYELAVVRADSLAARRGTDSLRIWSQEQMIGMYQRRAKPRCGTKCGVYIGVGATVLAAVALKQVQDLLARDHEPGAYRPGGVRVALW